MKKIIVILAVIIIIITGFVVFNTKKSNNTLLIERENLVLKEQSNYTLKVLTYPEKENITYEILDNSIATIDSDGNIDTLKTGTTKIKVKTKKETKEINLIVSNEEVAITGIEVQDSINIKVKDKYLITSKIYPETAQMQDITYTSSDDNIVKVNDGYIEGLQKGSAQVTLTIDGTKISDSVIIEVGKEETKEIKSLSYEEEVINLGLNETYQLNPIIEPIDASNQEIIYDILDPNIIEINNGVIKALSKGETDIVAKTSNNKTFNLKVKVTSKEGISLNIEEIKIAKGETYQLKSNFISGIEWYSNNNKVAIVDNGLIKGINDGEAIITVINSYGRMNTVKVRVEGNGILVNNLTLNKDEITIQTGKSYQIGATIIPSNATNKTVIYETSDSRIAIVDDNGLIRGKVEGSCIITAYSSNNKSSSVKVNVTSGTVTLETLEINPNNLVLGKGDKYQLSVNFVPSNVSDKNVIWSSNDTSVVKVNDGKIEGIKTGTATISASSNGITSDIEVEVKNSVVEISSVDIVKSTTTIFVGARETIQVNYLPSNASNKNFVWTSSDNSIATVSNKGVITGVKEGKATIYAESTNGKKDSISVNIQKNSSTDISSIILSLENINLQRGETKQIRATIIPITSSQEVTWISNNESIVRVNNGLLTAVSSGTTTVVAIAKNGMIAKAKIKVQYSPIDYPSSSNVLKYIYSNTIRVSLVKEEGYYVTRIWMADPSSQMHKTGGIGLSPVPSQIFTAASEFGLQDKIIVATNASGFHSYKYDNDPKYNNSALGRLIITEGKVLRNDVGYDEHLWSPYYYYIIDADGNLSAEGGKGNENNHNNIINNIKAYNTFAFYPVYFENKEQWAVWGTQTARRQGFCQIDGNNYAIVTTGMNGTLPQMNNIFISLNCKTAVNTDGGGSTSLIIRNRGESLPGDVIIGGQRAVPDALYFSE